MRRLRLAALLGFGLLAPAAEAACTYVGQGTEAAGTGNISPGLPSGWQAGDLHLILIETSDNEAAAPSGWAHVANSSQVVSSITRLSVLWRRAQAGDTNPTISDPGNHAYAIIAGFRGCAASGDPWDVSVGGTDTTTSPKDFTGGTTSVANTLIAIAISHGTDADNSAPFSSPSNANLTNLTVRFQDGTLLGNGGGVALITGEWASAGDFGTTQATMSPNASIAYIVLALKEHVAAGPCAQSRALLGVGC